MLFYFLPQVNLCPLLQFPAATLLIFPVFIFDQSLNPEFSEPFFKKTKRISKIILLIDRHTFWKKYRRFMFIHLNLVLQLFISIFSICSYKAELCQWLKKCKSLFLTFRWICWLIALAARTGARNQCKLLFLISTIFFSSLF